MPFVLTGSGGVMGSRLGQRLLVAGHETVVVDRLLPYLYVVENKRENVQELLDHPR